VFHHLVCQSFVGQPVEFHLEIRRQLPGQQRVAQVLHLPPLDESQEPWRADDCVTTPVMRVKSIFCKPIATD
jgi:hypothetical protein